MWTTRCSHVCALMTLGVLAAGCETGTAPDLGIEFDPDAALADYEAVDGILASSGWAGFQALGSRTPFGASPAPVGVISGLSHVSEADAGRAFALDLIRRLDAARGQRGGPALAPIISGAHRGMTFVYDPDIDDYTLDPDRGGAPDIGVRFIIYEVDDEGLPIVEEEIGYADLLDEGDGSAQDIVLHLIMVVNETTVLDYLTTLDHDQNRGTLTVHGFLQGDDGVRLDFDIEAVGTEHPDRKTLDVAFDLRVDSRDFSITGSVSGVEEGSEGEGHIEVTVRHRSNSIRVDVSGEAGKIDGSVFLNGDLFATISADEDEPTILSADGDPLTPGELLVLRQILDTVEDVFDFLEDLVDPVDELVVLGIIL